MFSHDDPRDLIIHRLFCVAKQSSRWLTDCVNDRLPQNEQRTEVSTSAYLRGRRKPSEAWIRACAAVVGVDADDLVAAFEARAAGRAPSEIRPAAPLSSVR